MKIVYVIPGSGGSFYCENCLRDMNLVHALETLGHEVHVLPMYLPLMRGETPPPRACPVFYGALSLYFGHISPGFRRLPGRVRRVLDARPMLNLAARRAGSTRAQGLEDMTISMLRGEEGGQADELDRMTAWLEQRVRPDVVHLSNALLLGLARRLKERLGARIVCSLQDEDTWVDAMRPDMAARVWNLMAERAADVDMFLPVSHRFGSSMQEQLRLPADRVRVVPLGVDTDVFVPPSSPPESPALGYVSRQCESMGLGILVEAFTKLKREPEFKSLLLWITGGATGDDRTFLAGIRQRLRDAGILADVRFVDAFDTPSRVGMLQTCMALSVPVLRGEAFGLYQLEAMACGVPVVQPALGAFPEVAERTGGGVIYEPNDAAALAGALAALLRDPERRAALRRNGLATVRKEFSLKAMARRTSDIYHELGDAHD